MTLLLFSPFHGLDPKLQQSLFLSSSETTVPVVYVLTGDGLGIAVTTIEVSAEGLGVGSISAFCSEHAQKNNSRIEIIIQQTVFIIKTFRGQVIRETINLFQI